jgi:hypothetical protein
VADVVRRVVGDVGLSAAIRVHRVDLEVAVPVAGERYLGAVRGPLGFVGTVSCEEDRVAPIRVHGEDLG